MNMAKLLEKNAPSKERERYLNLKISHGCIVHMQLIEATIHKNKIYVCQSKFCLKLVAFGPYSCQGEYCATVVRYKKTADA